MASGLGTIGQFLGGTKARDIQTQRYTPEQQSVLDQLLQQGMGDTDFGGIEDLAMKRFGEETIPSIAERFTQMGGQRSSAFQSRLGRAGADLQTQLAALRPQFGMQKLMMGLQPRFDPGHAGATKGFGHEILPILMKILPMLLGIK